MSETAMEPLIRHTGSVVVMDRANVDTDQIIPKQFLKRIERSGFGKYLFYDWRFTDDGGEIAEFELNRPAARGASILVARRNFGSGSSREHAVWALADYGFRVIIAPSFADIFYNNCFKNGVLPIRLDEVRVQELMDLAAGNDGLQLSINLEGCEIRNDEGLSWSFSINEYRRQALLKGLDEIAQTLEHADQIATFEQRRGMSPAGS